MNTSIKIIFSIIMLAIIASCDSQKSILSAVQNIDAKAAQSLVSEKQSVVILDVRTPEEYKTSHINGAVNIDISDPSFSDKVAMLDRDKTYIVHCAANVPKGRTAKSLVIMNNLGFNDLLNLDGGIVAWEQAGQPLIKSEI